MKRVFLVSLGCPKNLVDSEVMLGLLTRSGFAVTPREEEADVLMVNTCAFIREAQEESIETILELARFKEKDPSKLLVVTGCLSQRYPLELPRSLPEVDHFLGTGEIGRIVEVLRGAGTDLRKRPVSRSTPVSPFDRIPVRLRTGPVHTAFVKIAEGCSNRCAYCVIPSIRGPLRSRSLDAIRREVEGLVEDGAVEVNLVAQDVAAYGMDRSKKGKLPTLLRSLRKVKGLKWLRLLYCHPVHVTDALLEVMAEGPPLCRYMDLPIQHIDDRILARMNRRITGREIRSLIERIRKTVPGVHLRTTVLVGFPGETDRAFQRLLGFLQEAEFERLGAFPYSREKGTPSWSMKGQVPEKVKDSRLREVMELQASISRRRNRALVGTIQEVLVEGLCEESEHLLQGRIEGQAPGIDGSVYITSGTALPGTIVRSKIVDSHDYDLAAEILS